MKNLENYGVLEMDAKKLILTNAGKEINEGQCIGGDLGGSTSGSGDGFWEMILQHFIYY